MKKLNIFLTVVVVAVMSVLVACAPQISEQLPMSQAADVAPSGENYLCVTPESDNGHSWKSGTVVCYDTKAYTLSVRVLGDISSNQTVSGTGSGFAAGGYASYSSRMWTDGKGVLPVQILSVSPVEEWLSTTSPYIIKTTDLKFMGVPPGGIVTIVCQHDVEVLSPSFTGQTLTKDKLTNELDNCRMVTGNYTQ